ncbi:AAA family ATPase [Streptomyces beigongshangae]|uniref:AAA family ATPase n=1 Tax=Streptomyces beigongshangae TaxID=2841597 RepID=UPI001C84FDC6|nr:AAA family ATPase [Streptomyces sp. REN17]
METPRLEEVRLTSFKSFTDQRLPLQDLTVLIGRNGSGKSNSLDALMVLSRLALGEPVRDALDGPRSGGEEPIRGGAEGCAPLGESHFALGCRVRSGGAVFDLDVEIAVSPEVRILREELTAVEGVPYGGPAYWPKLERAQALADEALVKAGNMESAEFVSLVRRVMQEDARLRERAVDEVTDWTSAYSEAEAVTLATLLSASAALEADASALEAQLHAILELTSTGHVRAEHLGHLREIDRSALPVSLGEYVADLLDE